MIKIKERVRKGSSTGFAILTVLIIAVGWRLRGYELITAERGVGYVCGIIGFVLMSILLLYPLRKRVRALEMIGGVKTWFRIHMLLGIIGP
ncbi:MAG: transcriptional regulator, partial [Candidatus Omnitrophica bacterium]|nr:transcriptional regulator [Candidatus Omnitrophota bacterium]